MCGLRAWGGFESGGQEQAPLRLMFTLLLLPHLACVRCFVGSEEMT